MSARTLKIEATGDFHAGKIKPKIRLTGKWLEQAGFRPGARVHIEITASGRLVLTSSDIVEQSQPAHDAERKAIMARIDAALGQEAQPNPQD